MVLGNGWYNGTTLLMTDFDEMKKHVPSANIHRLSAAINKSVPVFESRAKDIVGTMTRLFHNKGG